MAVGGEEATQSGRRALGNRENRYHRWSGKGKVRERERRKRKKKVWPVGKGQTLERGGRSRWTSAEHCIQSVASLFLPVLCLSLFLSFSFTCLMMVTAVTRAIEPKSWSRTWLTGDCALSFWSLFFASTFGQHSLLLLPADKLLRLTGWTLTLVDCVCGVWCVWGVLAGRRGDESCETNDTSQWTTGH